MQRSPAPDRRRALRGTVAPARQAQLPRCRRAAAATRVRGHARGSPVHGSSGSPRCSPSSSPPGGAVRLASPGTSTRPARRSPGAGATCIARLTATAGSCLDAERTPRQACRATVPAGANRGRGAPAAASYCGPAPRLPAGDPLDPRPEGPAPNGAVPQQLHRAPRGLACSHHGGPSINRGGAVRSSLVAECGDGIDGGRAVGGVAAAREADAGCDGEGGGDAPGLDHRGHRLTAELAAVDRE